MLKQAARVLTCPEAAWFLDLLLNLYQFFLRSCTAWALAKWIFACGRWLRYCLPAQVGSKTWRAGSTRQHPQFRTCCRSQRPAASCRAGRSLTLCGLSAVRSLTTPPLTGLTPPALLLGETRAPTLLSSRGEGCLARPGDHPPARLLLIISCQDVTGGGQPWGSAVMIHACRISSLSGHRQYMLPSSRPTQQLTWLWATRDMSRTWPAMVRSLFSYVMGRAWPEEENGLGKLTQSPLSAVQWSERVLHK